MVLVTIEYQKDITELLRHRQLLTSGEVTRLDLVAKVTVLVT